MRNIDFEIGAELVLGPLLIAFCVLTAFRALRRHPGWTGGHAFTRLAAAFYAAAVLDLTIFPIHVTYGEYANQTPWYDLVNFIPLLVADLTFVPNLLMLVPLGFLLPLMSARPASPARAASIVAFRASRLVCPAMSLMSCTTAPTFCAPSASARTVASVCRALATARPETSVA